MILDTSAVVAILFGEPEADDFTRFIFTSDECLISAGNYLELTMVLHGQLGSDAGRQADAFFRRAGIEVEPFTVDQAHIARQAFLDFGKGRHPAALNFGDCFAYALAVSKGQPLLFKGNDFRKTDIAAVV